MPESVQGVLKRNNKTWTSFFHSAQTQCYYYFFVCSRLEDLLETHPVSSNQWNACENAFKYELICVTRSHGILRGTIRGFYYQFSYVQSLSCVPLFTTPWTAARQASLSITNSGSLLKLMSIESVMPSNHLILCCPLLLPLSIFPSIRVFSSEYVLCIRCPKYWNFSFSISPSSEYSGLIFFKIDWLDLLSSPRDS